MPSNGFDENNIKGVFYPGVPLVSYPNNGIYCVSSNDTEFVYNPNSRNVGTISYERDVLER